MTYGATMTPSRHTEAAQWPNNMAEPCSLSLAYQPVIDIARGHSAAVAFESLLRLTIGGVTRGPMGLVEKAEANGSIVAIDRWVLNEVIQLARVRPMLNVWINTSQLSIADPDFLTEAIRALIASRTLGRISFEITETANVDADLLANRLDALKMRAITVLIDDIRDGYAKKSLLLSDAVAGCKLSRETMLELHTSERARGEVEQLLRLCRLHQKKVVLEGIETDDDLAIAKDMAIPLGQGYFFARPTAADSLTQFPQMHPGKVTRPEAARGYTQRG